MDDLKFIKEFSKITITGLCKRKKIDRSNLIANRTTKKNYRIIREEIEKEIARIYKECGDVK